MQPDIVVVSVPLASLVPYAANARTQQSAAAKEHGEAHGGEDKA